MSTKQQPQQPAQPQYAPQPDPNAQYGPAPQPTGTPYMQQPVNQQYFSQSQAAPVQYVVMAESLKGLKGWLLFFTVCFGLGAITNIAMFFAAMTKSPDALSIVTLIFSPFTAIAAIAAVVLISMNKRIGRWAAIGSIALNTLHGIVTYIIAFVNPTVSTTTDYASMTTTTTETSLGVPGLISSILVTIIVAVFISLYFVKSRRVQETLVD